MSRLSQVEDTYKWDNVLHCEGSKRVNYVGICCAPQVGLCPSDTRIKTSAFSVGFCRASVNWQPDAIKTPCQLKFWFCFSAIDKLNKQINRILSSIDKQTNTYTFVNWQPDNINIPCQLTIGFCISSIDNLTSTCLFVNWQRDDVKILCQLTNCLLTPIYVNWQQKVRIVYGIQYGLQGQPIMNMTTDK